ncbi:MAG TPA: alkaline phosphatase family protein [Gemmatimonas sp.]|nr:alkaline phosphatase family protein [Gemmatimonas sp.]
MTDSPVVSRLVSRVVCVVLDGLRADVVELLRLRKLQSMIAHGASCRSAQTVAPSVTAAAMGSLFTGVRPADHGLNSDRFRLPQPRIALDPMPRVLRDAGIATRSFLAQVPWAYRGVARGLARMAGVTDARFSGDDANSILDSARDAIHPARRGLFFFHWPDADRAGHAHGWTSRRYMDAARRLDEALERLDGMFGASSDPDTLLIALADHGGGGVRFRNHDSTHPHDRTIPIVLSGGRVSHGELAPLSSLLDVPPTILWALGVSIPHSWCGRPMTEAFADVGVGSVALRPGGMPVNTAQRPMMLAR